MKFRGVNEQYFETKLIGLSDKHSIENLQSSELILLWFDDDGNELIIDNVKYTFNKNEIVCLTEFHRVEVNTLSKAKMIKWNKYFYCIISRFKDSI